MNIHCLTHVPFENPGSIRDFVNGKGWYYSETALFEKPIFPTVDNLDILLVMGGPMGVYEEDRYPWLIEEKKFIEKAAAKGKTIVGICLGAQLIADVAGAKVYKNPCKEIGWYEVYKNPDMKKSSLNRAFPDKFKTFHWHGDTFDLPSGAELILSSEATKNQAFVLNGNILALQCHPEVMPENIQIMLENCSDDLTPGKYVMNAEEITSEIGCYEKNRKITAKIFENIPVNINRPFSF